MTQDATWHHTLIFKQKLLECLKSFPCLTTEYLKYKSNLLMAPMSNRGNQHTKTSLFCRLEGHWLDELGESSKYCRVIYLKIKTYCILQKHCRQVEILQSKYSRWSVQELSACFTDYWNFKTEFDQPMVTSWTPFKSGYLTSSCLAHINTSLETHITQGRTV